MSNSHPLEVVDRDSETQLEAGGGNSIVELKQVSRFVSLMHNIYF